MNAFFMCDSVNTLSADRWGLVHKNFEKVIITGAEVHNGFPQYGPTVIDRSKSYIIVGMTTHSCLGTYV